LRVVGLDCLCGHGLPLGSCWIRGDPGLTCSACAGVGGVELGVQGGASGLVLYGLKGVEG
jgi:hypothetical protein